MPIINWPLERRPRERLIRDGAAALTDAELLAIFLRVGVHGKDAVQLGQEMVHHFGSLHSLFGASLRDFSAIKGLGPAKFAQLQAVMELARRAIMEEMKAGATLGSPRAVKEYLRLVFSGKPFESFYVLFLDVKNRLIFSRYTLVFPIAEVYSRSALWHVFAKLLARARWLATTSPTQTTKRSVVSCLTCRTVASS
jgi:DNA repair protein RadC